MAMVGCGSTSGVTRCCWCCSGTYGGGWSRLFALITCAICQRPVLPGAAMLVVPLRVRTAPPQARQPEALVDLLELLASRMARIGAVPSGKGRGR